MVSAIIQSRRPDLNIRGVDVVPRAHSHIPIEMFDGTTVPYHGSSFDVVLLSDVLHHTSDPALLQKEAYRLTRRYVLIKDHTRNGFLAGLRLRVMDWAGNARFGIALPYTYWTRAQWQTTWKAIGLHPERMITQLHFYPPSVDWVFGAKLHFIALLRKC